MKQPNWLVWVSGVAGSVLTIVGLVRPVRNAIGAVRGAYARRLERHRTFGLLVEKIESIARQIDTNNGSTIGQTVVQLKKDVTENQQRIIHMELTGELYALERGTPTGICDSMCYNLNVSQAYCEFTGCTKPALLGYGWKNVVHPDDLKAGWETWQTALGEKRQRVDMQMRVHHHSKGWVPMRVSFIFSGRLDRYFFILYREKHPQPTKHPNQGEAQ